MYRKKAQGGILEGYSIKQNVLKMCFLVRKKIFKKIFFFEKIIFWETQFYKARLPNSQTNVPIETKLSRSTFCIPECSLKQKK